MPDDKIRRVVLCSARSITTSMRSVKSAASDDVYISALEQLYPVPLKALVQELGRFKNAELIWCQEEPRNMGAWHFMEPYLEWVLNRSTRRTNVRVTPARRLRGDRTGLMSKHLAQLKALLDDALS